jgi:hypothetical protein
MPGLVPGIHVFLRRQGVDGRVILDQVEDRRPAMTIEGICSLLTKQR